MKYSCDLMRDLLPLYLDGVCSEESRKAVEAHLSECPGCKEFYAAMGEADGMEAPPPEPRSADQERKKAASLRAVKKKLAQKQLLAALAAVAAVAAVVCAVIGVLKNTVEVVEYEDNISVSMVDGDLVGRVKGSSHTYVEIKRVGGAENGQEKTYLFFRVSDTKWDALTTSPKVFSEYTLCFKDKGADEVDAVYYFTGEYTGIESMSSQELQGVIGASELLWTKA